MRPRHPDPNHKMPLPTEADFMNLVGAHDMEDADLEKDPDWDGLEDDDAPEIGEDQDEAEVSYP